MGKTKKIIGLGLGLAVLVTSMGLVFATDSLAQTSDKSKPKSQQMERFRGKGHGKGINLGDMAYFNVLSDMVTAGTITADQQKAIQKSLKLSRGPSQTTIKASLDGLVKAGTITQTQEDAVIKAYEDAKAKMKAEQEKRLEELATKKGITVDELKRQMESMRIDKWVPLNEKNINIEGKACLSFLPDMVTAGTITAEQQKAIQESLKPSRGPGPTTIKASLDGLVKAGTITQTQEDTVIKAYEDAKAKMKAEQKKRLEELAAQKGITVDKLEAERDMNGRHKVRCFKGGLN